MAARVELGLTMGASNSGILVYGHDLGDRYGYSERYEAETILEDGGHTVELVSYSYEMTSTFLAAVRFEAYQGGPTEIELTVPEGADEALARAVETLGLTVEGGPRWLLGSEW